jgi:hypothetical protein
MYVADNPNTPIDVIEKLAEDSNSVVNAKAKSKLRNIQ